MNQEVSADDMIRLIEQLEEDGEFTTHQSIHDLTLHLTAISHYEHKQASEKVIKHTESFHLLLDHHYENEWLSDYAYNLLKNSTDALIDKWNEIS